MGIKLLSLNIEGHKHWDRIEPFLAKEQFEVLCLQELFAVDIVKLNQLGYTGYYADQISINQNNSHGHAPLGKHGVGLFSRLPHSQLLNVYYDHKGDGSFNSAKGIKRALIVASIATPVFNLNVATLHLTWTANGEPNAQQLENAKKVIELVEPFTDGPFIITGDLNAPRGRATYDLFANAFSDNIPPHYTTSLDSKLHRLAQNDPDAIQGLMVDGLFTKKVQVENVELVEGLSDHCGIVCDILTS